ncbi:hypothetical protein HMF7854_12170 [Sphingomonas ginkgonis]|uniref:Secreted protein n=1 Tax=Sphingomonas ginkgonis TaxID=2315330 RepID=A0A3R9YN14_9SPHN|nr:hypothetical protein [Sphingomonas ginkgonis]RST31511.1 hypothetical protein HMF7854_12170 [Sphingomonas ginkgonis]
MQRRTSRGTMLRLLAAMGCGGWCSLALAQSSGFGQEAQSAGPALPQISAPDDHGLVPRQVPSTRRPTASASQVADHLGRRPQVPQLSKSGGPARDPAALSSRSDSRNVGTEHVPGRDRCDANQPARSRADIDCNRLVKQAATLVPAAPSLTPEQRLLLGEQQADLALGYDAAARALADSGRAADSLAAQGIASVVLQPPVPPKPAPEKNDVLASEAAAIVDAVANGLANPRP